MLACRSVSRPKHVVRWYEEFAQSLTTHASTQPAVGAAKHRSQNAYLTAIFGQYIGSLGSDQFMNWIGIDNQFNSIQYELNWNWIERFWIGIELELKTWTDRNWSIQSIHFKFNSSFYKVKHFLYAILWKLQCDKQPHVSKHTRMLHCVFPVWGLQGSLDIKGWPLHQLFWDISSALTH